MKADSRGFLIADSATDMGELVSGIEGVHNDTTAILGLLRASAGNGILKRQKAANPNAQAPMRRETRLASMAERVRTPALARATVSQQVAQAARPVRERNSRGRFLAASPDLSPVARAVESLTRRQAAQVAAETRAQSSRENQGADRCRSRRRPGARRARAFRIGRRRRGPW